MVRRNVSCAVGGQAQSSVVSSEANQTIEYVVAMPGAGSERIGASDGERGGRFMKVVILAGGLGTRLA